MSTITPLPPVPPAPPNAPASAGGTPPPTRNASRVIAILTIALGAAVILGAVGSAIWSTVAAASVRTETRTVDVAGVESLRVAVDAASLRIEFADVPEATLDVTSGLGVGRWTFERTGDELTVETPRRFGPGWIFGGEVRATLTLPQELEGAELDAALELSAGELTVDGGFGDLGVDVGAGTFAVDGSARTLTAELSAGGADIELSDVTEADFSVSAGAIEARLTGTAPRSVTVDVSAGSLDLRLPDAVYDVQSDVSAGDFENGLQTERGARNVVDVTVSAGSATIVAAR
jgi:hypothetical protein